MTRDVLPGRLHAKRGFGCSDTLVIESWFGGRLTAVPGAQTAQTVRTGTMMSLLNSIVERIEDLVYGVIGLIPGSAGEEDDPSDDPLVQDEAAALDLGL